MDYLDYLVIYLDTCATSGSDSAKLAGAAFSDLDQARGGGQGLATSFWGYGENEMGKANYDGIARTATYTWTRATSTSGAAGEKTISNFGVDVDVHDSVCVVHRREEHVDRLPLASGLSLHVRLPVSIPSPAVASLSSRDPTQGPKPRSNALNRLGAGGSTARASRQ